MIHGIADKTIPLAHSRQLLSNVSPTLKKRKGSVLMIEVPGMGHSTTKSFNMHIVSYMKAFLGEEEDRSDTNPFDLKP